MKKRIGIDIDGVLTEEGKENENIWYQALNQYFDKKIKREKNVFDFKEAYNLTEKEIQEFLEDNIKEIYENVSPTPDSKKVLEELKRLNFTIYLITARDKKFNNLTLNWLNKHQIPFNKLFHEKNKGPLAQKIGVKIFIEDNKENAINLVEHGIYVLVMDKYHNRDIQSNSHIYRVENWKDIKDHIFQIYDLEGIFNK